MDSTAPILPPVTSVDGTTPQPTTTTDPAAAHQTAENFESFFLSQTFESMFSGVGAAKAGGVGIADAVQREILQAQETK
jgi:Rod binding domain-containing protein